MHAATAVAFGGPEVLEVREYPEPQPGRDEVVVHVAYADTLWLETLVRSGTARDAWPHQPPYVPGQAVSGAVTALGSGVSEDLLGARVVARTVQEGGYATEVSVPAGSVVPVPEEVGSDLAAAVMHDAVTALRLVAVTEQTPGDAVVVLGASGGLGVSSVQLARARAGTVVAVARGWKGQRVAELGPDAVVDPDDPDWLAQVRRALPAGNADVVLDNIGGELGEAALALLGPGGRFSGHGTPSGRFAAVDPAEAGRRGVTATGIEAVQLDREHMRLLTRKALAAVRDGDLAPVVGQVYDLDEAAAAHRAIEARAVFGTTLLRVAG